ncbi:hypothetical protein HOLleu_16615 [Holothuria leucospilota]|uniref:Uncharacterized protein n=1 Tax=Holothuria leucospilota TaxID=206669 RepID=A0A9Q1HAJ5_HOLLE|nr:hypothetical protein HOLleu_16615 [Holothuria leucospilota]
MCSILNMPPPRTPNAFNYHLKMVSQIAEEETEQQIKGAVERAKLAVLGRLSNPLEALDIVVTFDET